MSQGQPPVIGHVVISRPNSAAQPYTPYPRLYWRIKNELMKVETKKVIQSVFTFLYKYDWAKTWKKVHFGRTMHCLPQRLKSTFLEIFSSRGSPKRMRSEEKISKNVDFSLWGSNPGTTQTHIWNMNRIFFAFSLIVPYAICLFLSAHQF